MSFKRPTPIDEDEDGFPISLPTRWDNLTCEDQEAIKALHVVLKIIKLNPDEYTNPVKAIEDIEFTLQHLWGFERDAAYHTHWLDIKGCKCPQIDNRDPLMMFRGKIINQSCKWHGGGNGN